LIKLRARLEMLSLSRCSLHLLRQAVSILLLLTIRNPLFWPASLDVCLRHLFYYACFVDLSVLWVMTFQWQFVEIPLVSDIISLIVSVVLVGSFFDKSLPYHVSLRNQASFSVFLTYNTFLLLFTSIFGFRFVFVWLGISWWFF